MLCPKCSFEPPAGSAECPRCGVIFARLRPVGLPEVYDGSFDRTTVGTPAAGEDHDLPPLRRLDRAGRRALGVGLALAVVVLLLPFARFVLSYLGVLVHELGHSVVAWLFGYPALPAFDFVYGGGVSISFDRSRGLLWLILGLWAALFTFYRQYPRMLTGLGAFFALWVLLAATPLHEMLGLAMGHGGELVFAGIFLYRAATGSGCRLPEVERPLYGMVGWFLTLEQAAFAWGLVTDPDQRQLYADAKGGGHWMDFSRLARDYWGTSLESVAGAFLVACLLTPLAAWAVLRHRERAWAKAERWLARRSSRTS